MKYHVVFALSLLTGGAVVCGSVLSKKVASAHTLLSGDVANMSQDTCATNDLKLPLGGMRGRNGVYWGFLPDDAAGTTMATINCKSGMKAST
jgi:hypothetical protein